MRSSLVLLLLIINVYCKSPEQVIEPQPEPENNEVIHPEPESTTIWLIRHAEKDATDPNQNDPGLSADGEARANNLVVYFKDTMLVALYATKYKRSIETITPLANDKNLTPKIYEALAYSALVDSVIDNYLKKNVLVVGHSNTLIPIIKAFGAVSPVQAISDSDYNYIFRIKVDADTAIAEVFQQ